MMKSCLDAQLICQESHNIKDGQNVFDHANFTCVLLIMDK